VAYLSRKLYVGCCGFPYARKKYYEYFKVVELQNTFYELPSLEWGRSVRREAPEGFVFTIKAWQVITHPHTSPTWSKMKKHVSGDLENYGYLKPTRENLDALEKTLEVARELNATFIVLQTPGSMPYDQDSVKWVNEFFERARSLLRSSEVLGWEPRGEWLKASELKAILERHGVVHVVDTFRAKPLYKHSGILYIRLHGIGPGEVNYSYTYTEKDLLNLKSMILQEEFQVAYVLFNNVKMLNNALEFKKLVEGSGGLVAL
jgi:uncharacterized protein YecE (DUF72 family)